MYLSDKSYLNRQEGTIPLRVCTACRYQVEANMSELGPLGMAIYREHKRKLASADKSSQRISSAKSRFRDRGPSSRFRGRRGVPIESSFIDHGKSNSGDNKGDSILPYCLLDTSCDSMDFLNPGRSEFDRSEE